MNIKLIFVFLVYYLVIGSLFLFGSGFLGDATTTATTGSYDTDFNADNLTGNETGYIAGSSEVDFNIWNAGEKVLKTIGFMFFGLGLPSDTPGFMKALFIFWQTAVTIMAVLVIAGIFTG